MYNKKITLHPGVFHLLSCEEIQINQRLKLAKFLWENPANVPRKEQFIINWITSLPNLNSTSSEAEIWRTTADLFNSFHLCKYFVSQPNAIQIKPWFIKVLLKKVVTLTTLAPPFNSLMQISNNLLMDSNIASEINKNRPFQNFASSWFIAIHSIYENQSEVTVFTIVESLMRHIMLHAKENFDHHNNSKKCMSVFLDNLFIPTMEILCLLEVHGIQSLVDQKLKLKDFLNHLLFSRKNMDVFEKHFSKTLMLEKQSSDRDRESSDRVVDQFCKKITDFLMSQKVDQKGKHTGIVLLYELFSMSYKKSSPNLQFQFYSYLQSCLLTEGKSPYLTDFHELSVLLRLYAIHCSFQSLLDRENTNDKKTHFTKTLDKLLQVNVCCSEDWFSCILSLLEMDYTLVKSKLIFILNKLLKSSKSYSTASQQQDFFNKLSQHFKRIRKQSDLLHLYLEALKLENKEVGNLTVSKLFASAFALHCIPFSSHKFVLEILNTIKSSIQKSLKQCLTDDALGCDDHCSVNVIRLKHKLSYTNMPVKKKVKMYKHKVPLVCHYVTLLTTIMEECDIFLTKQQYCFENHLKVFLKDQLSLVSNFYAVCRSDGNIYMTISFIHLISVHFDLSYLIKRYFINDSEWMLYDKINGDHVEWINSLTSNVTCIPLELLNTIGKWLCTSLQWAVWCDANQLENHYHVWTGKIDILASNLIVNLTETLCNNYEESDADSMLLALRIIENCFHIFVKIPFAHDYLLKLLFLLFTKKTYFKKQDDCLQFITKLFCVPSFGECTAMHIAIVVMIINKLQEVDLGHHTFLQLMVDVEKLINEHISSIQFAKSIEAWFSCKKTLEFKDERTNAFNFYLHILGLLPKLPFLHSSAVVGILFAILGVEEKSHVSRHAVNITLKRKVLKSLDILLVSYPKLTALIPMESTLTYLTSSWVLLDKTDSLIAQRITNCILNSCCHDEKLLQKLTYEVSYFGSSVTDSLNESLCNVSLLTISTNILKRLKIIKPPLLGRLFAICCPSFNPKNCQLHNIQSALFSYKVDENSIQNNSEDINVMKTILTNILKEVDKCSMKCFSLDLKLACILATFTLCECQVAFMASKLEDYLQSFSLNLTGNDDENVFLYLKILLLKAEIQLYHCQKKKIFHHDDTWLKNTYKCLEYYGNETVKSSSFANVMVNRIFLTCMQMCPSLEYANEFLISSLLNLQKSSDDAVVKSQLAFIVFFASLYDFRTSSFMTFVFIEEQKEKVQHLLEEYFREAFQIVNIGIARSSNSELAIAALSASTAILNLKQVVVRPRQVSLALSPLLQHQFSFNTTDNVALFGAISETLNVIVVFHREAVVNMVPIILSVCGKLLDYCLLKGRQSNIQNNNMDLDHSLACSRRLERLFQYISSNYGSYFKRCVPFFIADFIHGVSRDTIHPKVKKSLDSSLYNMMSLCDEYSEALLRTSLPPGIRNLYRQFHLDYSHYFKYTGKVYFVLCSLAVVATVWI